MDGKPNTDGNHYLRGAVLRAAVSIPLPLVLSQRLLLLLGHNQCGHLLVWL